MKSTRVAIHQPNFFPWLGYFDKIARSDIFIFLDHVQYQKTGGLWSNRVLLLVGGIAHWVTGPLDRGFHGVRAVNDMRYQAGSPWRKKFIHTLAASYGKAPFYRELMPFLEPLISNPSNDLTSYNTTAIISICEKLDLPTTGIRYSSKLESVGHSSEMLASLTRTVGGDLYMCGGGADGYQDEAVFSSSGVAVVRQDFDHPIYEQRTGREFIRGLSIIDALMFCGFTGVKSMLQIK